MLKDEIIDLSKSYSSWIFENLEIKEIGNDCVELTTPFLDRHNDCIQFYIQKSEDGYVLTDGGYFISDLLDAGFNFSERRENVFKTILSGFEIDICDDCLKVYSDKNNFPELLNNLIQASVLTGSLYYLSEPTVEHLFFEDVKKWMGQKDVIFQAKKKLNGKTGYSHEFHFSIQNNKSDVEKLVQTVQNARKMTIGSIIWMYEDVTAYMKAQGIAGKIDMAIIFKEENAASKKAAFALESSGIQSYYWPEKESLLDGIA